MEKNKHIAIAEVTKKRIGGFIPKDIYWDEGLNNICDFLDSHNAEFSEFLKKRKDEN